MYKNSLKAKTRNLPELPGVYLMKDATQNIIYIGKSKHLKTRVSGYWRSLKHERPKVKRMVSAICDFDYQVTDTELDALLLECRLIKMHQPIYNTLLKNDKKYRFIKVVQKKNLSSLAVAYKKEAATRCFGPYDMPYLLVEAVKTLNHYYKLPTCKEIVPKEDCLIYRLNNCLAPCEKIGILDNALQDAINFLEGKNSQIINDYQDAMQVAAESLDFEKAMYYREQLTILKMLGYRKEAIALSEGQDRGIALLKCPTVGYKLYILRGTSIKFTKLIKSNSKQVVQNILQRLYQVYLMESSQKPYVLEKHQIDEALIMYFYLHTKTDCCYIDLEQNDFNKACDKLLSFYFSK